MVPYGYLSPKMKWARSAKDQDSQSKTTISKIQRHISPAEIQKDATELWLENFLMASLVIMMDSSLPSNQQLVVLVLESMPIIIKLTKTYPNEKSGSLIGILITG